MKKRLIALTATICACVCAFFAFAACTGTGSNKGSPSTNAPLAYNKKYIYYEDVGKDEDAQHILIFQADGTGIYKVLDEYFIRFKYIYTDSGLLHCFCNSLSGDVNSASAGALSKWTATYFPAPEVLYEDAQRGGNQYICETYLPNIPNFGKYEKN